MSASTPTSGAVIVADLIVDALVDVAKVHGGQVDVPTVRPLIVAAIKSDPDAVLRLIDKLLAIIDKRRVS